jgi:cold shock protein
LDAFPERRAPERRRASRRNRNSAGALFEGSASPAGCGRNRLLLWILARDRRLAFRRLQAILDSQLGDRNMALGTVKWFNSQKGYGFIQPQAGGQDVFVHISAVERAGLSSLNEGQQVEYEIVTDRGKQSAGNLKVK